MSDFASIEVRGVDDLREKLRTLLATTRQAVRDAVATATLLTESDAKVLAPVDTGRLRSAIHSTLSEDGLRGVVVAGTEYAVWVEFGRRGQRAQPFLSPAYEKNRLPFLARLKAAGLSIK